MPCTEDSRRNLHAGRLSLSTYSYLGIRRKAIAGRDTNSVIFQAKSLACYTAPMPTAPRKRLLVTYAIMGCLGIALVLLGLPYVFVGAFGFNRSSEGHPDDFNWGGVLALGIAMILVGIAVAWPAARAFGPFTQGTTAGNEAVGLLDESPE